MEHIVAILALVALIIYWRGPNAVWGGATLGVLIGGSMMIFSKNGGWYNVEWAFAIGVAAGLAADLLGKLSDKMRK